MNSIKNYLKRLKLKAEYTLLKIFSSHPFLSVVYYLFSNDSFKREYNSVLNGRLKYFRDNIYGTKVEVLLTRNIHRLEKGLIMKERRPVFALEYIEETVDAFVIYSTKYNHGFDKGYKWFLNVLQEYFNTVDLNHPILNKVHKDFISAIPESEDEQRSVPYQRDFTLSRVSYQDLFDLSKVRRSVRWFENKEVPRELIDKALEIATLAPSACNRQPFEFRIYDEKDLVQKVANITWGTTGFSQNFPAIIMLTGHLDAYFDERDRHVIYIDASLSAMSFMYALETLGLSSCPINWPDVGSFDKQAKKILNLEPHEKPIMLIAVGYPDKNAKVPFSEKKSLNQLRTYNKI